MVEAATRRLAEGEVVDVHTQCRRVQAHLGEMGDDVREAEVGTRVGAEIVTPAGVHQRQILLGIAIGHARDVDLDLRAINGLDDVVTVGEVGTRERVQDVLAIAYLGVGAGRSGNKRAASTATSTAGMDFGILCLSKM